MGRSAARTLLLVAVALLSAAANGWSEQNGSDVVTQTDDDAKKQAAAEARAAEAAAVKAELENEKLRDDVAAAKRANELKQLPNPNVTVPNGSISVTDQGKLPESELLAYREAAEIAKYIAQDVKAKSTPAVAFYREDDIATIGSVRMLKAELSLLESDFDAQIKRARKLLEKKLDELKEGPAAPTTDRFLSPSIGEVASLAEGLSKTAAEIVSLFQTTVSLYGVNVTMKQDAIEAAVAGALRQQSIRVYNPHLYAAGAVDGERTSDLIAKLTQADKTATALDLMDQLDAKVKTFQAEAQKEPTNTKLKASVDHYAEEVKKTREALASLVNAYQKLRASLYSGGDKAPAGGPDTPLAMLLRGELVATALKDKPYLLTVSAVTMGGSVLTKQNLWTSWFWKPQIYHSGGIAITFTVYDKATGELLATGTYPLTAGFVKGSDIRKTLKDDLDHRGDPIPEQKPERIAELESEVHELTDQLTFLKVKVAQLSAQPPSNPPGTPIGKTAPAQQDAAMAGSRK